MTLELLEPAARRTVVAACTERQVLVLDLMMWGTSVREIARRWNVSRSTVRDHEEAAMRNIERADPALYASLLAWSARR